MSLPALRCDRKCIQNDLDVRRNTRIEIISIPVYARVVTRIQIFVCTSGRNATQAKILRLLERIL